VINQNQVQKTVKAPHKKGNIGKIIALVVLLLVLAGFLLNTMYPKEIKDLFNKFSGGEMPEMPNNELVLSGDIIGEENNDEIIPIMTGTITT